MKMPEIAADNAVMAALGGVIVVILVTAVAATFFVGSPGSKAHSVKLAAGSKDPAALDPCSLVTPKEASAAFGVDAGVEHVLLGACLYDIGAHKLIVALTHDNAKGQFATARAKTAKDVAGIGDAAYVQDGRLRLLKGPVMAEISLLPADPTDVSPALVSLGREAAPRL